MTTWIFVLQVPQQSLHRCVCLQACSMACCSVYRNKVKTCGKALTPCTCAGQAA